MVYAAEHLQSTKISLFLTWFCLLLHASGSRVPGARSESVQEQDELVAKKKHAFTLAVNVLFSESFIWRGVDCTWARWGLHGLKLSFFAH